MKCGRYRDWVGLGWVVAYAAGCSSGNAADSRVDAGASSGGHDPTGMTGGAGDKAGSGGAGGAGGTAGAAGTTGTGGANAGPRVDASMESSAVDASRAVDHGDETTSSETGGHSDAERRDAAGESAVDGSSGNRTSPFAADIAPTQSGDVWRFAVGGATFEVNATKGASVTTFSLQSHNVLADGSHFRPSPQKTWNWPPPAEIAQSPYTASLSGKVVTMESQTNKQWAVKAKKRFWANSANQVVTIEYTLTNTSTAAASWGPWEVSRVNPTGLTFFPEGGAIAAKPASFGSLLPLQSTGGIAWLDYKAASYTSGGYIVAKDGLEGWAAHVESSVVFIKSFDDIPAAKIPPEEGEVQLWTDNTHTALEMENEGAYQSIPAGGSITWLMRWYLRALPSNITATSGSAQLVDYVRSQVLTEVKP